MTTTRERKEARAARLEEWSAKRAASAAATFKRTEVYRGDHAFNTQPGHIPERARVIRAEERAFQDMQTARRLDTRAAGIRDQADRAIYSDDVDAIERLEERVAELTRRRDAMKAANTAYRKAHRAALATMTPYRRDQAMPHQGFELTNLSADIRRNAKRLEDLRRQRETNAPQRVIRARRQGACEACNRAIEVGDWIGKWSDGWLCAVQTAEGWVPGCGGE